MSRRYIERATREGRVALLPEWLRIGSDVWYWRESLCDDDCCADMDTISCPLSAGFQWFEPEPRSCARQHPVLEKGTIWAASAVFTERGVMWSINDLPPVPDCLFLDAFFTSEAEARKHRPGEVV